MPYKDPAAQREYQRQWTAARRARYTAGMACVDCGSGENLEMDHVDPAQKVDHRIWTWSAARLRAELDKCVPRCAPCHHERHAQERRSHGLGGYRRGCRCDVCRGAKSVSQRRYREARKDAA